MWEQHNSDKEMTQQRSTEGLFYCQDVSMHAVMSYYFFVWVFKMRNNLEDCAPSWVDDTQSLVLADGADSAAVLVPADTVDQVWVGISQLVHEFPCAHVPHTNHIITAWREGDTTCNVVVLVHRRRNIWKRSSCIICIKKLNIKAAEGALQDDKITVQHAYICLCISVYLYVLICLS